MDSQAPFGFRRVLLVLLKRRLCSLGSHLYTGSLRSLTTLMPFKHFSLGTLRATESWLDLIRKSASSHATSPHRLFGEGLFLGGIAFGPVNCPTRHTSTRTLKARQRMPIILQQPCGGTHEFQRQLLVRQAALCAPEGKDLAPRAWPKSSALIFKDSRFPLPDETAQLLGRVRRSVL